ncbi:hypothetical protein ACHAXR_003640 [Thalassiosira sp. AJA248-18]
MQLTMATGMMQFSPQEGRGYDSSSEMSQSSCPTSQAGTCNSFNHTAVSSFYSGGSFSSAASTAGSEEFDESSLDSIGRMLIKLEDNDASLTDLVVDCKSIDKEAAAEIEQYLPDNTRLKKLRLHCGSRSRHLHICHCVISGLKDNSSVEYVEIRNAEIDHEIARWLVPSLAHSRTLKHINMISCKGIGLEDLFVAMQWNKRVQQLTFRSCDWEDHITDIMASSLPLMKLHSLSLIDMNISIDGWPYLFRKISECRELQQLDLSRNELDESIVYLLARSLTAQMQISKLSLASCWLDTQCIKELATGLRYEYQSPLISLDISQNNQLNDCDVVYLQDLLLSNNSIIQLKTGGCGLNNQSLRTIESGLRYNNSCMKFLCPVAIFDIFDFIGCEANTNIENTTIETEKVNDTAKQTPGEDGIYTDQTAEARDECETNDDDGTQVEDERSPPIEVVVKVKDDDSIKTEARSIHTRGQISFRSRRRRAKRTAQGGIRKKTSKAQALNIFFQA